MKSKKILALLGMSTVLLGTVPVFADEVGAVVTSSESVIVDDGIDTVVEETPVVSTPIESSKPVVEETPVSPVEVSEPVVSEVVEELPISSSTTTTTDSSTSPSTVSNTSPTTSTEQPKTDVPTNSTVTEEVPFVPVKQADGSAIVGVNEGRVVVQAVDGSYQFVAPEGVGAKVEADGSVHVQNAEGKLTRLPETGAEEVVSMMTSFSGVVLLISTLYLKFKKGIL